MAISTGLGLALAGGAGLLGSVVNSSKSSGSSAPAATPVPTTTKTVSSTSARSMPRPKEYTEIFDEFNRLYFGKPVQTSEITTTQRMIENLESQIAHIDSTAPRIDKEALEKELDGLNKIIQRDYGFTGPYRRSTKRKITVAKLRQKEISRLLAADSSKEHFARQKDTLTERLTEARNRLVTLQAAASKKTPPSYAEQLKTVYDEKRIAEKGHLDELTALSAPYLGTVEETAGTHKGLLDEITQKRMAGEAVGPYAADIDKLLAERTGISFGGGEPMQFITGPQQRLLSSLLPAQEAGLKGIQETSGMRMATEMLPAEKRYDVGREIADLTLSKFMPSNIADLAYLQDLKSMWEPMEFARFGATPSTSTTGTTQGATFVPTISPQQQQLGTQQVIGTRLGNLNQLLDIATGVQNLWGENTGGTGLNLIPGSAAQQGIPNVMTIV